MRGLSYLVLLGGVLALPVHATDAQDWLGRLAEAEQQQSFHGTFVYERNGSFSTHTIWHQASGGAEVRERLLQLDGPVQEVLRVNGRAECVSGGLADSVADGQNWPARALDAKQLAAWYDLRIIGESRVAGRDAVVLAVLPRDQHRYGFELHLDRETGLPLKSLLLNEKGQLLERFQFSSIDMNAPAEADLKPGSTCQPVRFAESKNVDPKAWHSEWLPPGFALNSAVERHSAVNSEPVACLMYGDGLARFSVFLEPLHGATVEDARTQLGPTVAVSKRISTTAGDVMVTVIGEIPLGTAERVALSMRAGDMQAAQ
jgi:sigma-E factor negative regulatory protein RseB